MGRRSTKSSPAKGAALPFDTVGVTILPGVSLPEWAEPHDQPLTAPGPELIADAEPLGQEAAVDAVIAGQAAPPDWAAAVPAMPDAAVAAQEHGPLSAMAPEPAYAMAGAAMAGAVTAGAAYGTPSGYGQPAGGYAPEPSRYPAAPAASLAAPTLPASAAPAAAAGQAPVYPPAAPTPEYAQGWTTPPPAAASPANGAAPALTAFGAPAHAAPAGPADHPATGGVATAAAYAQATATDTRTFPSPAAPADSMPPDSAVAAPTDSPAPSTPSEAWGSPDRTSLSPQHVALLSWWADMMAAGQFPAPTAAVGPDGTAPSAASSGSRKRSFPFKAAALGLVAVAAVGTAAVVGPRVMASDEPVAATPTTLSMPAAAGDLVALTDPSVGAELQTLLGFGLRPTGVTVTGAYGTAAGNPLVMAAMATTMGAPAEAVGQIATWAERTGATVSPSVAGTGANEGITCAAVESIPEAQPGSFCVWTASGERGQTYSVEASVEDAQMLTNQFRTAVSGS